MEVNEVHEEKWEGKTLTRRELFPLAGKAAVGAAGLAVIGGSALAIGCGDEDKSATAATVSKSAHDVYPWPYTKLTADEVQAVAYENWFEKFCCYAVTSAILGALQEKVGYPYTSFPIDSTAWGHGGAVGWGTLCGTLTGAGYVTGLIVGGEDGEAMLNDIINWYTVTQLPLYQPEMPKTSITNVSASDSPLCHISVGKWMKKENVKFFSDQRKDRCARL